MKSNRIVLFALVVAVSLCAGCDTPNLMRFDDNAKAAVANSAAVAASAALRDSAPKSATNLSAH